MIEGIKVLSMNELTDPSIAAFVIVFLIFSGLSIVAGINSDSGLIAIMILIAGLFFAVICSGAIGEPNGKHEYKVLIDDSVSMNELMEKYEIVDEEGLIYTIKEREIEND